jgi:hypothetical protein
MEYQIKNKAEEVDKLITVFLDEDNRITGKYQSGDWSRHRDIHKYNVRVMRYSQYMKEVEENNRRAREAMVISPDELAQCGGFKDSKEMMEVYDRCY